MSWTGSEKSCGSAAAGWEAILLCCFVILHYIAAEETEKCVESLLRLAGDKKIIIVDNASPNGSGKKLQEMYRDEAAVDSPGATTWATATRRDSTRITW